MAAATLEVAHASLRMFIAANSKPGANVPAALKVPRPADHRARAERAAQGPAAAVERKGRTADEVRAALMKNLRG